MKEKLETIKPRGKVSQNHLVKGGRDLAEGCGLAVTYEKTTFREE